MEAYRTADGQLVIDQAVDRYIAYERTATGWREVYDCRTLAQLYAWLERRGRRGRTRIILYGTESTGATRYERVAEAVRSEIEQGGLSAGSPVPSEFELAEHFRVSGATVRQALMHLEHAGQIERRAGRRYVPGLAASSSPTECDLPGQRRSAASR